MRLFRLIYVYKLLDLSENFFEVNLYIFLFICYKNIYMKFVFLYLPIYIYISKAF